MSPRLQGGGAASGPGPVIDVPGAFGGAALAVVAATPPVANAGGGGRARNDQRPAKAFKVAGRHQDLRQEEEPVLHCQDKPKVQEEPKVLQEEPQVLLRAALPPLRP